MSLSGSRPPSSVGMKRGSSVNVPVGGVLETVHEQVQSTLRIGDTVLLFSQEGQGFVYSDVSRCARQTRTRVLVCGHTRHLSALAPRSMLQCILLRLHLCMGQHCACMYDACAAGVVFQRSCKLIYRKGLYCAKVWAR